MRHRISEAEMESRRRQALIAGEVTDAISRAFHKDADITYVEVIAAPINAVQRCLSFEMTEDDETPGTQASPTGAGGTSPASSHGPE